MDTYLDIIRNMLPHVPREKVKKLLGHALNTDDYGLILILTEWLKVTDDRSESAQYQPGSVQTDEIRPMEHDPAKARIPELKEPESYLDQVIDYLHQLKRIEQANGVKCRVQCTLNNTGIVEIPNNEIYRQVGDAGGRELECKIVLPNYKDIDQIIKEAGKF